MNTERKKTAAELSEYKKTLKLNDLQKEILIGTLLGDATIVSQKLNGNFYVKFEQSETRHAYVQHLYEVFKPFVGNPPKLRYINKEKTRQAIGFRTYRHLLFRFYRNMFYQTIECLDKRETNEKLSHGSTISDERGIILTAKNQQNVSTIQCVALVKSVKIVPKNIHRFLTPRALAYWFMDDGTYQWANAAKTEKIYELCTHGFQKHESQLLCDVLANNFNISASVRKDKTYWRIFILKKSCLDFKALIEPYIHSDFIYKI